MNRFSSIFFAVFTAILSASTAVAAPKQIDWETLAPEVNASYENPFETLTTDQMDDLRQLLRYEMAEQSQQSETAESAKAIRSKLESEGLDVDWLFEQRLNIMAQRQAADRATNGDILGEEVLLPGYILPLEVDGQKVVEFLLVPTIGACIHTPPPPANQMVHVLYPEGIEISGLYQAVWIIGEMREELSQQDVRYSDGQSQIEVTYMMQPDSVELYEK